MAPAEPAIERQQADRLREILLAAARDDRLITYRDLAAAAEVPEPYRIHKVTLALEALIEQDHRAGRPLLASFAVSRARDGLPGRGFFLLLAELGRYDGPPQGPAAPAAQRAAHRAEREAARRYWASP